MMMMSCLTPLSHTPQGSQAYAKALSKAGILTGEEAATIVDGLDKV
jgi:argininosuccinate lyase